MIAAPQEPSSTKPCSKCGESKPLDEFHKCRASRDGKSAWCKGCFRIYNQARRWQRHNHPAASIQHHAPSPETPGLTLPIAIRPGLVVLLRDVPGDLSKAEADRIGRVIMAHVEPVGAV